MDAPFDNLSLKNWLRNQPLQASVAIAARAALRVSPYINLFPELVAPAFRAIAVAQAAAAYPARAKELRIAADAAATGIKTVPDYARNSAFDAAAYVVATVSSAARSAEDAAAYAVAAAANAAWLGVVEDASILVAGCSASALASRPLWPEEGFLGRFPPAGSVLELLRHRPPDENWDVWIDWYRDRLVGRFHDEFYELVFASVPPQFWDQGPAMANRWIKEHLPKPPALPRLRPEVPTPSGVHPLERVNHPAERPSEGSAAVSLSQKEHHLMASATSNTVNERILILYASPGGEQRLRIDKEHRMIENLRRELGLDQGAIIQRQAATLGDVVDLMNNDAFSIIQFSGHGSPVGLSLEEEGDGFIYTNVVDDILNLAHPSLKLAIFMSCYSRDMVDRLKSAPAYSLTVNGEADDVECLEFITSFYRAYFQTGSINRAVRTADIGRKKLSVSLVRKDNRSNQDRKFISSTNLAQKEAGFDELLIDVTDIDPEIDRLKLSKEHVYSLLCRKIRMHRWALKYPRDMVLFPVGRLFGLFSWENPHDMICCKKLFKLKDTVSDDELEKFITLIIEYNDIWVESYRAPLARFHSEEMDVERGLIRLEYVRDHLFSDSEHVLGKMDSQAFKICKATVRANLGQARIACDSGQHSKAVQYMEAALSAMHDLIDQLGEEILE